MSNQLSLFGPSVDKNTFQSAMWGCLTFYSTNSNKWQDNCRHCLLWVHKKLQRPDDECLQAPCSHDDREDGRDGYFSIHNMPEGGAE